MNRKMFLFISTFYLLYMSICIVHNTHAKPKRCLDIASSQQNFSFEAGSSKLFYIENKIPADVFVVFKHESKANHFIINPSHAAAFKLNHSKLKLSCIESRPGSEQRIDCNKAFDICALDYQESLQEKSKGQGGNNNKIKQLVWFAENLPSREVEDKVEQMSMKK